MLEVYLNQIASGVLTGLVYGLATLGLSVIFGVCRIINFAHGEMMVVGMYLALVAFRWFGLDPLCSIPIVGVILFACGYALQAGDHQPAHRCARAQQFILLAAIAIVLRHRHVCSSSDPICRTCRWTTPIDSYAIGPLLIDKVRVHRRRCAR